MKSLKKKSKSPKTKKKSDAILISIATLKREKPVKSWTRSGRGVDILL